MFANRGNKHLRPGFVLLCILLCFLIIQGFQEQFYADLDNESGFRYDVAWISSSETISFADLEMSTPVSISLVLSRGWLRDWFAGKPDLVNANSGLITGSPDGTRLALRYVMQGNPTNGYPMLLSENGSILRCPKHNNILYGSGRFWVVSGDQIVIVYRDPDVDLYQVVLFDMITCEEVTVLYAGAWHEIIDEATLSPQGWLAVMCRDWDGANSGILILDAQGNRAQRIPNGMFPAWSPSGDRLVYTVDNQDIYVVSPPQGPPVHVATAKGVSYVAWSPEGSRLLYGGYEQGGLKTQVIVLSSQKVVPLPFDPPAEAAFWRNLDVPSHVE